VLLKIRLHPKTSSSNSLRLRNTARNRVSSVFVTSHKHYKTSCMSAQASVLMSWIGGSVANLAFFPRIWACFLVELRFFFKTCGLLVFGLVSIEFCLFFGLVFCRLLFFQILWHFCRFNLLLKAYWACFREDFSFWACFFGFATLIFFYFLPDFSFC